MEVEDEPLGRGDLKLAGLAPFMEMQGFFVRYFCIVVGSNGHWFSLWFLAPAHLKLIVVAVARGAACI